MKLRGILVSILIAGSLHAESSAVLGKIGDIEVKTSDIRESLAGLDPAQRTQLAKDPAALSQYVRALLLQRLVLKQALEKKWDEDPAVVSRIVRARETAITESFLEAASTPDPGYPSDSELKDAYESNKSKLLIPRSFHLSQIYISVPENADTAAQSAAKSKLDGISKQLAAKGADFAAIARKSSEEPASAAEGGKIGWLTEAQIQPEIRAKIPKLSLGSVSEPIRLADGWHILKVLDIREARTPALEEIRDQLVTQLRKEREALKRQQFLKELLEKNPLAINEIELMKLP
jgi:parvulin-like peptidyl-prolyl isomerase